MKKSIYFFAIFTLLLSSCKLHHTLHFVQANPQQRIINPERIAENVNDDELQGNSVELEGQKISVTVTSASDEQLTTEIKNDPDTLRLTEDSDEGVEEAEEMVSQAFFAEKLSKAAMGTSIAAVASFVGGILGFIGIPLFIASLILYSIANRSRYNTEKGARKLKVARVFLTIFGIVLAVTLTIILLLFLFL